MKIKLNDEYQIVTDEYNYILQKINISKKTGKPYLTNIGYCSNFSRLLDVLVEKHIKASPQVNTGLIAQSIENFKNDILEKIKKLED